MIYELQLSNRDDVAANQRDDVRAKMKTIHVREELQPRTSPSIKVAILQASAGFLEVLLDSDMQCGDVCIPT